MCFSHGVSHAVVGVCAYVCVSQGGVSVCTYVCVSQGGASVCTYACVSHGEGSVCTYVCVGHGVVGPEDPGGDEVPHYHVDAVVLVAHQDADHPRGA